MPTNKEKECIWHSPTEATLMVGKQVIEIKLSRPTDPKDLAWLYQGVFEFKQLINKGLSSVENREEAA